MMKYVKGFFQIFFVIAITFVYLFSPLTVQAKDAITIQSLKSNLQVLQNKEKDAANQKTKTQDEINNDKQRISSAYTEKESIANQVEETKNKVEESQNEIERTSKDIDSILKYYQLSMNSQEFMEYITGASTTTEMIMRSSAVEQISTFYKNKIETLQDLIVKNQQLQIDLTEQNKDLDSKINNYANALDTLSDQLDQYNDVYEDLGTQIERAQEQIKYYQSVCNSETQDISTCSNDPQSYGWLKPLEKGAVISEFGYRPSMGDYHYGVDIYIGNSKLEGTPEYAAASGRVAFIKRYTRGGNTAYIYVTVNGKKYTLEYAHMLTVNVTKNQIVTTGTVIGTMGGYTTSANLFPKTGYDYGSYGAHLHFGVATGWYGVDYDTWSQWQAHNVRAPGIPSKGVWWYRR